MKKRIKMLSRIACCIAVLAGVVLLCLAIYYQQRVEANNELLSKAKSIPGPIYRYIVSFNASMRTIIPLFTTIGIILCMVGGILFYLPRQIEIILSLLLLTVILFPNLPLMAYGTTAETKRWLVDPPKQERWLVDLTLHQPNAVSISGLVYVYDNYLSSTNPDAWVAFRIGVGRVDTTLERVEWIEGGYFEYQGEFWIYGASYIEDNYVENDVTKLAGEGSNGEDYLDFAVVETDSNKFAAYMFDSPGPGVWLLMEAAFTIGGDNMYVAGSESNDPYNSLNGHYAELMFSDGLNSYEWQNVESNADYPYSLSLGSTNEFFTEGGNYHTLTISSMSGGTTDPSLGTHMYNDGTLVNVTASAYSYYKFKYWVLDGARVHDNPLTVMMYFDHALEVHFSMATLGGGGGPSSHPRDVVW